MVNLKSDTRLSDWKTFKHAWNNFGFTFSAVNFMIYKCKSGISN